MKRHWSQNLLVHKWLKIAHGYFFYFGSLRLIVYVLGQDQQLHSVVHTGGGGLAGGGAVAVAVGASVV